MADSLRERCEKRYTALKSERDSNWLPEWKELGDFISPRSGRWYNTDTNDGKRRDQKIINPQATFAARTLGAGMHTGMTNPSSPWVKFGTPDPGLMDYAPVKEWLFAAEKAMREVMARGNLYSVLPNRYSEEGIFGTAPMVVMPDDSDLLRSYPLAVGSYMLANNSRNQVDTLYRDFRMTGRQMEQQFGKDKMSTTAQNLLASKPDAWIDICHGIEPNDTREKGRKDNANMPFRSVYWEKSGDKDSMLRESGFKVFPVMAPRWDVLGEDVYGTGPGSMCIGTTKAIQLMERRKAELLEKGVRPPMGAPASLKNQRASILPGSITYLNDMQVGAKFAPLYEVQPAWLGQLRGEIAADSSIIDTAFFVDLFLMISQMDSVRTAYEIATRKEEKLLMLGPVLERQTDDLLDPLVDMYFNQMLEQSIPRWQGMLPGAPLLPPPPKELANMDLRIEFTSILAQAQKAIGVSSIERAIGFAGTVAATTQSLEPLDLLDGDEAMRQYFELIGVPPTMVRADDMVSQIRQQRAQQQQAAQMQQELGTAIQGAQVLSQTDTSGDNALTALAGAV
ncbi:portal protein [Pseudomonas asgharzadehiana]|uniref:Phage tail protein n=1 Tax=Pseudomonas asgharzadehiana TaxID=2842349 RepID=A0ABX8P3Z7_9PSED|nr:portal protein [Pseudomonas asgharzadehiana]QXH68603.1 phage tail protein [Pseudomonas asgharzadehiana]